jgi:mono/diheme cytochrome c family protein
MSAEQHNPETHAQLPVAGILAEFDSPEAVKAAAVTVREAGFKRWDVHSPYPIHGIERAMGMRSTILPWLVLGAGTTGLAAALFLQWWTNAVSFSQIVPGYPMNISGKPFFSLPANIPVIFELMVLFSAIAAFGGVLVLNLLPQFWHWTFGGSRFAKITNNGFFISIDAADKKFDEATVRKLLEAAGAKSIEICQDAPAHQKRVPWVLKWLLAAVAVAAIVPLLLVAEYRYSTKSLPRIHPIKDLDFQEKYQPQASSPFFADGRAMRLPASGTVAVGQLEADEHLYRGLVDGQPATTFPMPVTKAMMLHGQERFGIYCAPCHGLQGDGGNTGIISIRAMARLASNTDPPGPGGWVLPLSMHKEDIRKQPVGQYFSTITNGVRTMPSYGAQIPAKERWDIILYIRALQKSRNATIDDVPEDLRGQLR